jgi:1-acyl-sn-glycerol-3-phosphate acyltransferase
MGPDGAVASRSKSALSVARALGVTEDVSHESPSAAPSTRVVAPGPEQGPGSILLSLLFWLWVAASGMCLSLLALSLFIPFNPWVDPRRKVMAFMASLWGRGIVLAMPAFEFQVLGRERLAACPGPVIFCSNHQSLADIPLLLAYLPHAKFLVRAGLFSVPVLGLHARLAGYVRVPTKSTETGEDPLVRAEFWLRQGCNVVIFPEGTRSPDPHRLFRFRRGAFDLARRVGVPLVPVAIQGTGRALRKGQLLFRFRGTVRVQLLEPTVVTGDGREAAARVRAEIQRAINEPG